MRDLIFVVVLGSVMLFLTDFDLGIRDALDPLEASTPSSMPDDLEKQLEEFNAIAREMDRTVREARERGRSGSRSRAVRIDSKMTYSSAARTWRRRCSS